MWTLSSISARLAWAAIGFIVTSVSQAIGVAFGAVVLAITVFIANLKNWEAQFHGWIDGLDAKIQGWFNDLPAQFDQFGQNIMTGMANGIASGWTWVQQALTDVANSIVSWFAGIMDMHSPSKVMEGMGENIMLGMANGIVAGTDAAVNAASAAAAAVSATLSGTSATVNGVASNVRNYLSPVGDVMRNTTSTTGTVDDPCASGGVGACIAEKITDPIKNITDSVTGSISGGLSNAVTGITGSIGGAIAGGVSRAIGGIAIPIVNAVNTFKADQQYLLNSLTTAYQNDYNQRMRIENGIIGAVNHSSIVQANLLANLTAAYQNDYASRMAREYAATAGGTTNTSTNNVVQNISNNFNNMNTGQRISFDYEHTQFWV